VGNMAYHYDQNEQCSKGEDCIRGADSIAHADAHSHHEPEASVPRPLVWRKQDRTPSSEAGVTSSSRRTGTTTHYTRGNNYDYSSAARQQSRLSVQNLARHNATCPPLPSYTHASSSRPPTRRPAVQLPQTHPYATSLTPRDRLVHDMDHFDSTVYMPFTADSAVNMRPASPPRPLHAARQKRISLAPMQTHDLSADVAGYKEYLAPWDRVKQVGRVVAEVVWKDR